MIPIRTICSSDQTLHLNIHFLKALWIYISHKTFGMQIKLLVYKNTEIFKRDQCANKKNILSLLEYENVNVFSCKACGELVV